MSGNGLGPDRSLALRRPPSRAAALLVTAALVSTLTIWLMLVVPVLTGSQAGLHPGHSGPVVLHAVGGSLMLFAGIVSVYLGLTRHPAHRWIGRIYLAGGGAGALLGLYLAFANVHGNAAISVASGALGAAWLTIAGMGWRAALNRKFASHRDWMIRSYVLTWTFVFCRIVMHTPLTGVVDTASIIWVSWIAPLLMCEIVLQWRAGGRTPMPDARTPR